MSNKQFSSSLNPLVKHLKKSPKEFTKKDIIQFIEDNGIKMLNFRYVGGDGRLKSLNFVISDTDYLEQVLSYGERVDGSSLFSFVEAGSSDLYVIPRFRSAFVDLFAEIPTLCLLCSYYTKDGAPLEISPEYILKKAAKSFTEVTGMEFQAMGELEYYVVGDKEEHFLATDQKGYHESSPFAKFEDFRMETLYLLASAGCEIKYGHSEVGNFTLGDKIYEQNEIEFLVTNVEDAANQLIIAKWIIRKLADKYELDLTFAPKITTGKAGSGMHIHTRIVKDGKNQYVTDGKLNDTARTAIAGFMQYAPSLTAFGNTNPTSYLRLVPHQEAPTTVCWGDRNRSVLVRVPLGWTAAADMVANENPLEKPVTLDGSQKQTVEFRCPDCSADVYLLLAGLTVAARSGFEMQNALEIAEKTYVDVNIHQSENKDKVAAMQLDSLPASCWESAERLNEQREVYERHGVFPPRIIDGIIADLKKFDDKNIRKELAHYPDKLMELVRKFYYCG
ncbi:MAG: glutamine synthetase family protein [Prevotellaceae bacterium]|jgi:glutamine synthetase|nr:glutamine synthetase family protein [Prevotellaceae bacterium]